MSLSISKSSFCKIGNSSIVFSSSPCYVSVAIDCNISKSFGSCEEACPIAVYFVRICAGCCVVAFEVKELIDGINALSVFVPVTVMEPVPPAANAGAASASVIITTSRIAKSFFIFLFLSFLFSYIN